MLIFCYSTVSLADLPTSAAFPEQRLRRASGELGERVIHFARSFTRGTVRDAIWRILDQSCTRIVSARALWSGIACSWEAIFCQRGWGSVKWQYVEQSIANMASWWSFLSPDNSCRSTRLPRSVCFTVRTVQCFQRKSNNLKAKDSHNLDHKDFNHWHRCLRVWRDNLFLLSNKRSFD